MNSLIPSHYIEYNRDGTSKHPDLFHAFWTDIMGQHYRFTHRSSKGFGANVGPTLNWGFENMPN